MLLFLLPLMMLLGAAERSVERPTLLFWLFLLLPLLILPLLWRRAEPEECGHAQVAVAQRRARYIGIGAFLTMLGLGLTVYVDIKVEKHSAENAASHQRMLEAIPEVVAAHMVSGEADFFAEVVVPDLAAYEELLTQRLLSLPMVKDIRSNFVIRPIKTDGALPLGHLEEQ